MGYDLTGQRFGSLAVVSRAESDSRRERRWVCICDCGTTSVVPSSSLRLGRTKSCGCGKGKTIHGYARDSIPSREYRTWQSMKQRCLNQRCREYKYYGGRGITICDRWLHFENFLADMAPRPQGTDLDRVDNDGNYEPGNCRWASRTTQMLNTRRNFLVTFCGETMPLSVAAARAGIARNTIQNRMKRGWPESDWFGQVWGFYHHG